MRSLVRAGTVLAILAGLLAVPAQDQADSAVPAEMPPVSSRHRITLLTGDVVQLSRYADGSADATVLADVGPQGIDVMQFDGQVSAVPKEVARLIGSGRVDRRLFDLTALVADGYDDASAKALPVIAEYADTRAARTSAAPAGATVARRYGFAKAVALRVDKRRAATFWSAMGRGGSVRELWLDGKVHASLDVSVPYVGAPDAWSDGYDGTGTTVAVLDTGVDASHPDLAGKVAGSHNFTDSADAGDRNGHGTHVASTVAGSGAASGGARKGVAPGARVLNGKVLDDTGRGEFSWVMAGMEWAVAQGADVVNMSLGACCGDGTDPVSQLLNQLSASSDTLFVVAAGNNGPDRESIGFPGAAASALTVGAVGRQDDRVADFSSRGPAGAQVKPDITAPGTDIVAARAEGTLDDSAVDERYARLSGTSMATPHVAGAAAVLAQRFPALAGEQLKAALTSTAVQDQSHDAYEQGAGRLDLRRASRQGVYAEGILDFGQFDWPHDPDEQVSKTLRYTNLTDGPVTLGLSSIAWGVSDSSRTPTPALSVSPSSVTVPPGGTETATVTLRVPESGDDVYGGWVTARTADGAVVVRSSVGWTKHAQQFTLDIRATDRSGRPPFSGTFILQDLERGERLSGYFDATTGEAFYLELSQTKPRLRGGTYLMVGELDVPAVDGRPSDRVQFVLPEIVLDRDYRHEITARTAQPIRLRTPRPTDTHGRFAVELAREVGGHRFGYGWTFRDTMDTGQPPLLLTPTDPVANGTFTTTVTARHSGPPLHAELRGRGEPIEVEARYAGCEGWCWTPRVFPRIDGSTSLRLVELARQRDVRGSAVMVRSAEPFADELALAAQRAGAAVVVFWNPSGSPSQKVTEAARLDIPVLWVSSTTGARMTQHAQAGGSLLLSGRSPAPYVYDGQAVLEGRIPAKLDFAVSPDKVATIEREHRHAFGFGNPTDPRATCPEWSSLPSWLSRQCDVSPRVLTHYAIPGFGYENHHDAGWSSGTSVYRAGERRSEHLLAGPFAPGAVDGPLDEYDRPASVVEAGKIRFSPGQPFIESEPGRWAGVAENESTHRLRVYADERLVADVAGPEHSMPAEPRPARYRLEYDFALDRTPWDGTTRTRSVWSFRSVPAGLDSALPQLQARYDLPLDIYNRARAGHRMPFRFEVDHQPVYTGGERIVRADLELSYDDGRSWRDAPVRRTDDGWYADVRHPELKHTSGYVSVRLRAIDSAGNALDQTLTRAYRLR